MKELELYIHVPFCKSKCYYCDFCSTPNLKLQDKYFDMLIKESSNMSSKLKDYVVTTVFIGGGTPTILEDGKLKAVFNKIISKYNTDIKEFTVEANPDTITYDKLQELKDMGVNRLSIGVQTFNDDILNTLNRVHDSETAINAIILAKDFFDNVSVDLMIGLPNQTFDDIECAIKVCNELNVDHISCYTLQLEDKTILKKLVESGKIKLPDDDLTADMYNFAYNLLEKYGFKRYEISNFAKNEKISQHNYGYWTRKNYLGLGVSSHSLVNNYRFSNTSNFSKYILNVGYENIEKLPISEQMFEEIMLKLRTTKGLNIKEFNEKYNCNFELIYSKQLKKLCNYLQLVDDYLSIKPQFFEVSNMILVEFMED